MIDVRDREMFSEDDIPDFSKLGEGDFPASVQRAVARLDFTTAAAARAFLDTDQAARATAEKYRALSNALSDAIAEAMPNEG